MMGMTQIIRNVCKKNLEENDKFMNKVLSRLYKMKQKETKKCVSFK